MKRGIYKETEPLRTEQVVGALETAGAQIEARAASSRTTQSQPRGPIYRPEGIPSPPRPASSLGRDQLYP